ncbi:MAG TPA: peptide chain release factor 3 [Acidimicrobiales bacterium]
MTTHQPPAGPAGAEASRRRTFAIISHPDAGKTTLTEKFLLYAGAVAEAGAVKARSGRRAVTSDWMEMERQRGISITSAVLQFTYRDHVVNLLDTPGHRDFSEDTYRTLAAADAAVMVLDTAKGVEAQTLKLFEVARNRRIPVLTFLNKYDRPGRDPLELLDESETTIGLRPTPATWPVGIPGDFRGVVDRRDGTYWRYTRTARGATAAPEQAVEPAEAAVVDSDWWGEALEGCALLDGIGADVDPKSFLAGESTPVLVGSALTNFGVRLLLDTIIDLAPAPSPRLDEDDRPRRLDDPFSGFVFKVQANMDPAHRDRVAFVRVCSGRFERGMVATHADTGKPFATKYATAAFGAERTTIDQAHPGDVVGLVNASDLRVGDTLYDDDSPVRFPRIPTFTPEVFVYPRPLDTGRTKQFRCGLAQLDEEGVVQALHDPTVGEAATLLGAVGQMQFEVFAHRLANEFGAAVDLRPAAFTVARRTDDEAAPALRAMQGVAIYARRDGTLCALFESPYWLQRVEADHPELTLEPVLA